ncbi:sigma-70 family RNA polymerase sigma factor [Streptomyces justiciae]|uniref:Sigma-70 family RNA polymerase sigma factor n=1 Tax=Streptomyces justiciae TaxID=2780140 RepID=A0ABU3M2A5_9ACTN|nr:sigma-70 family RNA polymerase sigma factor [Streptomyces justiciae]MDT7845634.1 sigma-70 family RNA polymerase sigma factor [Streptomyces justiciae]
MSTPHRPTDDSLDRAADEFLQQRPRLFGIAYRILGSVTEAEDVVQDAWLRWQKTNRGAVVDPAGFLVTATARLAINVAQSARMRRETYVGPWLPEPVDTSVDPQVGAERGEALELAILVLMEKLKPLERAAYVLREAFDYPHQQIADILQVSQDNARQLVSRSRKRLTNERREPVDDAEHRRLLDAFVAAARRGDLDTLERLLSEDVASYADGNGMRGVARIKVTGRRRTARLTAFSRKFLPDAEFHVAEANGGPAMLIVKDGVARALVSITVGHDGIDGLYWVMTADKLQAYARSAHRVIPRDSQP